MASKAENIFTRIKENVMGTPEQNKVAQEQIDKYKASKEKEKMKEEEAKKKLAKGGAVKKATVKKTVAKVAKKPALAVMIAVGKPKLKCGGMAKKKK